MSESEEARKNREHKEKMQKVKAEQDAEVRSKVIKRGVLIVHTGDGKGKSTAAFGIAMRAAGHGQPVGIVQFIKGTWATGEQAAFKRFPEIEHVTAGEGFTWDVQDREKDVALTRVGWARAKEMLRDPKYQVVILDELNIVIQYNYLPIEEVLAELKNKREELSVVITGRDAKPELIEIADTVTEMRPIKHAYAAGIKARRGIEF